MCAWCCPTFVWDLFSCILSSINSIKQKVYPPVPEPVLTWPAPLVGSRVDLTKISVLVSCTLSYMVWKEAVESLMKQPWWCHNNAINALQNLDRKSVWVERCRHWYLVKCCNPLQVRSWYFRLGIPSSQFKRVLVHLLGKTWTPAGNWCCMSHLWTSQATGWNWISPSIFGEHELFFSSLGAFLHTRPPPIIYLNVFVLSVLQGANKCRPLHVDNEAEVLDFSELHYDSVPVTAGYVTEDGEPLVSTQTPGGYYNQPLIKNLPPPPTSLAIDTPTSPFRSVFSNPSYNLLMQPGEQQSSPGARLQEGTSLEGSFSEYQPQANTQTLNLFETTEEPENLMSCVSTYILLPKST